MLLCATKGTFQSLESLTPPPRRYRRSPKMLGAIAVSQGSSMGIKENSILPLTAAHCCIYCCYAQLWSIALVVSPRRSREKLLKSYFVAALKDVLQVS